MYTVIFYSLFFVSIRIRGAFGKQKKAATLIFFNSKNFTRK